jgi:hypothetical protein
VDEDISLLVKFKLDFFAPQIVYDSASSVHMVDSVVAGNFTVTKGGKCNKKYLWEQVVTVQNIKVIKQTVSL